MGLAKNESRILYLLLLQVLLSTQCLIHGTGTGIDDCGARASGQLLFSSRTYGAPPLLRICRGRKHIFLLFKLANLTFVQTIYRSEELGRMKNESIQKISRTHDLSFFLFFFLHLCKGIFP